MLVKYLHGGARRARMPLIDPFNLVVLWEYYGSRVTIFCRHRLVRESSGRKLCRIGPDFLVASITIASQLFCARLVKISGVEGRYVSVLVRIDRDVTSARQL